MRRGYSIIVDIVTMFTPKFEGFSLIIGFQLVHGHTMLIRGKGDDNESHRRPE